MARVSCLLEKKIKNRENVSRWRERNKDLDRARTKANYKLKRIIILILLAERDTRGKICCSECLSEKNLDIHHEEKLPENFKARHNKWNYLDELKIYCRSCHRKYHSKLRRENGQENRDSTRKPKF